MRELRRAVRRQEMDTGFEPTNFREITSKNGNRMGKQSFVLVSARKLANFIAILTGKVIMNHGMECDGIIFGFWYTARTILSLWLVAYLGLHDALLLLLRPRQHAKQACLVQVEQLVAGCDQHLAFSEKRLSPNRMVDACHLSAIPIFK